MILQVGLLFQASSRFIQPQALGPYLPAINEDEVPEDWGGIDPNLSGFEASLLLIAIWTHVSFIFKGVITHIFRA